MKEKKINRLKWSVVTLLFAIIVMHVFLNQYVKSNRMNIEVDETLTLRYFYENETVHIAFKKGGINELFGISQLTKWQVLFPYFQKPVFNVDVGTDWIGPYIVRGEKDGDDQSRVEFTGGWHGRMDDGVEQPTAKEVEHRIWIDGKEVTTKGKYRGEKVVFQVVNHIQGYNTMERFILEEKVTYTLLKNKEIQVDVVLKALENIRIEKYYGMQLVMPQDYFWVSFWRKGDCVAEKNQKDEPYHAVYTPIDTIKILDDQREHGISGFINLESDIDAFKYKYSAEPYGFTTQDRKTYFNSINGVPLELKKGDTFQWNGGYRLE